MESRIREVSLQMCESLYRCSNNSEEPVDVRVICMAWSADFITSCIFREGSLGLLTDSPRAEDFYMKQTAFIHIFPWVKRWPWIIEAGLNTPEVFMKYLFPNMEAFQDNYKVRESALARFIVFDTNALLAYPRCRRSSV